MTPFLWVLCAAVLAGSVAVWFYWPKVRDFVIGPKEAPVEPTEIEADPAPLIVAAIAEAPKPKRVRKPAKKPVKKAAKKRAR